MRPAFVLGEVQAGLAAQLSPLGVQAIGKPITLEFGRLQHALARHATERELLRGQRPLTHNDIVACSRLLNAASVVVRGLPAIGKQGHPRFRASTVTSEATYSIVIEGRKRAITIINLWKR